MSTINNLLQALDERTIAQEVGRPHDEARIKYPLHSNTAATFEEFSEIIGSYYNHHFATAVSSGGALSSVEAAGQAKEILEQEYRRRGANSVTAFNDAHDGTNGGLRAILDTIAEALKAKSVERYIRDVFDRYVAPNDWDQKVEIIREFINSHGAQLGSSIQTGQPERYAQNYEELIRSYVTALQRASSVFRRL